MRVRTVVAAGAALLVLLTGCTGSDGGSSDEPEGAGLTYLGDTVVQGEETLRTASERWRSTARGWNQVITVPDDSRCWFLADEDDVIAPDSICGPFRGLGSRAPEWVLMTLLPTSREAGSVRMEPGTVVPYDDERGYNARRLVDADGTEGSRDVEVPEPTGWPKVMPVGQSDAHPMRQFQRETVRRTRVRLLGHDYLLRIVTSNRVQFSDRSVYLPAKGGSFVDFRFRRYDTDGALEAAEALRRAARAGRVTLRVQSATGRTLRGTLRIPEQRGTGLRIKTYGPSGFFSAPRLDGASFVVSDGTQEYVITQDAVTAQPAGQ